MFGSNAPAQKRVDPQLQTAGYDRNEFQALSHTMAPDEAQIDLYPTKLHRIAPVWPMPQGLWIYVPFPVPAQNALKTDSYRAGLFIFVRGSRRGRGARKCIAPSHNAALRKHRSINRGHHNENVWIQCNTGTKICRFAAADHRAQS